MDCIKDCTTFEPEYRPTVLYTLNVREIVAYLLISTQQAYEETQGDDRLSWLLVSE